MPRALLALLLLGVGGCAPHTLASADREAARIVDAGRSRVPDVRGSLVLQGVEERARDERARFAQAAGRRISLREALEAASVASRDLRLEREDVMLSALALSTVRHDHAVQPFAGGSGTLQDVDGVRTLAGAPAAGFTQLLERGGNVALALAQDFLFNVGGSPLRTAQSVLALDLLLPMSRGAGWVARERLTQAERDVVYALRSYAFFQQRLVLDVSSSYYRTLQAQDTWQNEEATYQSLLALEARQRAHGREGAGRIPEFQVEQARQDTLRADDRRQRARVDYEEALDELKLLLGLPVDASLEPDPGDLVRLREAGPLPATWDPARAPAEALARRLDLRNARDQVDDAERRVLVARNGMGAQVDLALGAGLDTRSNQPWNLREASRRLDLGLALDLPLDRVEERNAWRTAVLQGVRAVRSLEGLEDRVVGEVRTAFRRLAEADRSFAIQREGVRLAERRVESTRLLLEAGQAETRDVLDAQNDLVNAQNALTRALVDHAIARLGLDLAVGALAVEEAPPASVPVPAAPAPAPAGATRPAMPPVPEPDTPTAPPGK